MASDASINVILGIDDDHVDSTNLDPTTRIQTRVKLQMEQVLEVLRLKRESLLVMEITKCPNCSLPDRAPFIILDMLLLRNRSES